VPVLHKGQFAFGGRNTALRAFLFVGVAYFVIAGLVLAYTYFAKAEPLEFTPKGINLSTLAGVLGAIGALGIVFALKAGGKPVYVAPLVFAGAPIVNTLVSMLLAKPTSMPDWRFFAGIVIAASGAALTLMYKPS
jgi:hypothetical protein